jgi:hypothetical protein
MLPPCATWRNMWQVERNVSSFTLRATLRTLNVAGMTPPDNPDLIDTRAAADILCVSTSTLSRWQAGGLIKAAHSGEGRRGPNLYHRADVVAMALRHIEATEHAAGTPTAAVPADQVVA